jgi:two-component system sensor histidine kinase KdpD
VSTADDPGKRAELVSTISHELRGPISTIKGLAATSRSFYDQLPDDEKREFLELIEQEADRMLEIVSEASLAMKLSARVLPLQRGPADLAEIVREGVEAAGLDHDRRVDLELADVSVEGDRTRLIEVVRQVVRNAAQYSPPDRPVEITLTREGDTAVLTIVDHGPGIPEERREQVFTTFPNWRPAGYEEVQGTGLGLFISRGLVAEHDGDMSIEDAPGGGTMLRIRLPAGRDQGLG